MHIKKLYLRSFRNYREANFEFSQGINSIYGTNAQGKTNLLEAIYFLMTGSSFRTPRLSDLIFKDHISFFIEAIFEKHGVQQVIKAAYNGKKHTITFNNTCCASASHFLGLIQGVLLSPEDNDLIKGPPLTRRRFIDLQLVQVDPLYLHHMYRYNRAMKQRNHLLKAKCERTIDSWEHEMAYSASYLIDKRREFIRHLNDSSPPFQSQLSMGFESLSLDYKTLATDLQDKEMVRLYFIEQLNKLRSREIFLGYSLLGPHKDDVLISISGQEAKLFASEGQQRCCAAALRLCQWQLLYAQTEELPLMLIDDIGIGLDASRKKKLFEHLGSLGQVFITSPDQPYKYDSSKEFHIAGGAIV